MPEYLSPGVYVEEGDARVHTIPGVPTAVDFLVAEIRKFVASQVPEWTDANGTDPGVTLLELFAWLSENLLYRAGEIPERGRSAAQRAASALSALGHAGTTPCASLTRPHYYTGQLLDAATLQAEQDYQREKLRRHNRKLHGFGVVTGLGVHVEPSSEADRVRIVVAPGYAIDGDGEEIAVCASVALIAPSAGNEAFVSVRFWEHPCRQVPHSEIGVLDATRVEEACVVSVGQAVLPRALALARLVRSDDAWSIDPAFVPPRVESVTT